MAKEKLIMKYQAIIQMELPIMTCIFSDSVNQKVKQV